MNRITVGDPRIHENDLGAILALMENADVPDMILEMGEEGLTKIIRMIPALNMPVRKMAFGILKCLSIYDLPLVMDTVPLIYHYHIEHPPDELNEYIRLFVEKRKQKGYLSRVGKMTEKFTPEELVECVRASGASAKKTRDIGAPTTFFFARKEAGDICAPTTSLFSAR
jgi:hypothetical protein